MVKSAAKDKDLYNPVVHSQVPSIQCQKALAGVVNVLKVPKHLSQGL